MTDAYYCENCGSVIIGDLEYDELKDVEKCGGEKDYGENGKYCESSMVINACHARLRHWKLNEIYYSIVNNPNIHFVKKVKMENRQYICPICGYKFPDFSKCYDRGLKTIILSTEVINGTVMDGKLALSGKLEECKKKRLKCKENDAIKEINEVIEKYEESLTVCNSNTTSNVDLKTYISKLVEVEMTIYSLSNLLKKLYCIKFDAERPAKYKYDERLGNISSVLQKEIYSVQIKIDDLTKYFNAEESTIDLTSYGIIKPCEPIQPEKPVIEKPEPPVMKKAGLFNRSKVDAENAIARNEYDASIREYEKIWDQYYEDVKKFNEDSSTYPDRFYTYQQRLNDAIQKEIILRKDDIAKKEELKKLEAEKDRLTGSLKNPKDAVWGTLEDIPVVFDYLFAIDEIRKTEEVLKEFLSCRKQLYSFGLVHSKYRAIVPLTSFYEYLDTRRCDSLEGADGAYNIFENELRQNIIISRLDDVISELENIQQNQFLLYSEIQKVNKTLDEMSEKMDRMITISTRAEKVMEQVAFNTAQTAYYSKLNAELTNALGFIAAYK